MAFASNHSEHFMHSEDFCCLFIHSYWQFGLKLDMETATFFFFKDVTIAHCFMLCLITFNFKLMNLKNVNINLNIKVQRLSGTLLFSLALLFI